MQNTVVEALSVTMFFVCLVLTAVLVLPWLFMYKLISLKPIKIYNKVNYVFKISQICDLLFVNALFVSSTFSTVLFNSCISTPKTVHDTFSLFLTLQLAYTHPSQQSTDFNPTHFFAAVAK